jgi:hypothetical protein
MELAAMDRVAVADRTGAAASGVMGSPATDRAVAAATNLFVEIVMVVMEVGVHPKVVAA